MNIFHRLLTWFVNTFIIPAVRDFIVDYVSTVYARHMNLAHSSGDGGTKARRSGTVKLVPDGSVTLASFRGDEGIFGGTLDCSPLVGTPNAMRVIVKAFVPQDGKLVSKAYQTVELKRENMQDPLVIIDPFFCPHGAELVLEHLSGMEFTVWYDLYLRRP